MAGEIRDDGALRAWRQEDHDVARRDCRFERATEVDRRQVPEPPRHLGSLPLRGREHFAVEVYPHDVESAPCQLAPDAARATSGIEHGPHAAGPDEVGLAVDIFARQFIRLVPGVVVVAGRAAGR